MTVYGVQNPELQKLLIAHPEVEIVPDNRDDLCFGQGRRLCQGNPAIALRGLVELVDNNPMVCADEFSVPGPLETLLLMALGPLSLAGLVLEPPVFSSNLPAEQSFRPWLETINWPDEVLFHHEEMSIQGVGVGVLLAKVPGSATFADLVERYEEAYGRSFYVQVSRAENWDPSLVVGERSARIKLNYTPDDNEALLKVRVMASLSGKCGAGQMIHAFNVMCGFEESLP